MPNTLSMIFAALFLFFIGVRIILIAVTTKKSHQERVEQQSRHVIAAYVDDPRIADKDTSGEIGMIEALLLGVAVSMNALTTGLGAGLMGLSPVAIPVFVAAFSFLAIWAGVILGEKVANIRIGALNLGQFSTLISGGILLLIAAHMILTAV